MSTAMPAPTTSQTSVCTNDGLRETIESSLGSPGLSSDYAALSPSDIALLDGPDIQPSDSSIQIPKVEIKTSIFHQTSLKWI